MADQKEMSREDVSKCPICFEQLKTPRVLPCTHMFCHGCVSSHIVSTCQTKEFPVGFHCPVCREFVPAPNFSLSFKDWSKHLPTKRLLQDSFSKTERIKVCAACERENETEGADNYCLSCCEALCDNCTKCHRKNRVSRDHKICLLDEVKSVPKFANILCKKHKGRSIELFCNDHEEICCTMCCSIEHRKCENVETIEQKAENVRKSGLVRHLINDIEKFERKLSEAKNEEEKNITEMEDQADAITGRVRSLKNKAIQNLETLENEFLDNVSTKTNKCNERLTKSLQTFDDIIQFSKRCRKNVESATNFQDVNFLTEYFEAQRTLQYFLSKNVEKCEFKLQLQLAPDFIALANLPVIGRIEVKENKESLVHPFDVQNFNLEWSQEIHLSKKSVRSAMFLSNTDVIFPFHTTDTAKRYKYSALNDKWVPKKEISFPHKIFDIQQNGGFIYASCPENGAIVVLKADDFQLITTIFVGKTCYGISFRENVMYVACYSSILKMDTDGNKLGSYPLGGGVNYVAVTKDKHIVFSNEVQHTVTSLTDKGDLVWKYKHQRLNHPCGLHIDSDDLIYVAGKDSHNIHILRNDGAILHIIKNIHSPVFFMLNNARNICCCVGIHRIWSWDTSIKMYKIKK
ncbi:transcription intermediary factor 1-beta-like [Saccostrea cucullata]|uniref:transcription intermediary factor 1-beta-like n=1 Tax=Saccostrea cuccullata TaxID=36930 RepID=UPI002ED5C489